ncbi:MAG: hypothetical protein ACKVOU_12890, partial [Cytophagales bacterium]
MKIKLTLLFQVFALFIFFCCQGQINVSPATGGINICTGSVATLSNITITASNINDFNNGSNTNDDGYKLFLPTGFIFAEVPAVTTISGSTNIEIDYGYVGTVTSSTFRFRYSTSGSVAVNDGFVISNIKVLSTSAGFGFITRINDGLLNNDATVTGSYGINYGLLSSINTPNLTPIVANASVCGADLISFVPNTVSGVSYNFYTMSNNLVAMNATSYSKTYANGVVESFQIAPVSGICQANNSLWATVTGTSFNVPSAPSAANTTSQLSVCEGSGSNPTLSVTGGTLFNWYADQNLTILLGSSSGGYIPSPAIITSAAGANFDYYVTSKQGDCESPSRKISVTVTDVPSFLITNLSSSYCASSQSITINAFPTISGANGIFTATKLSGPGNISNFLTFTGGNYSVSPANVTGLSSTTGTNINLIYTVTVNGCVSTASNTTNIFALPSVDFVLPSSPTLGLIRDTDPPFSLVGSPADGSFAGTGVAGNDFDVRLLTTGTYTVTYTASLNGCTNSINKNITVVTNTGILNNLLDSYCQSEAPISINVNQAALPESFVTNQYELVAISGPGVSGTNGNGVNSFSYTFTPSNVPNFLLDQSYNIVITTRKLITSTLIFLSNPCPAVGGIFQTVSLPYINPNAGTCITPITPGSCSSIYNYGTGQYTCGTINPFWQTQTRSQLIRVKRTPAQPTISNLTTVSNCIETPIPSVVYQNYTAVAENGATVRWWSNSATPVVGGGSGELAEGNSQKVTDLAINTSSPNTTNILLTQEVNGCLSPYSVATPIVIKDRPTFPQLLSPVTSTGASVNYAICVNQPTPTLSVSTIAGYTFRWYTSSFSQAGFRSSLPEYAPSTNDFTSANVATYAFNVSQVFDGCESATALQVNLIVKPLPAAPNYTSGVNTYCKDVETINAITLSGAAITNTLNMYNNNLNILVASNITINGALQAIINKDLITQAGINTNTIGLKGIRFTQVQEGCESQLSTITSFFISGFPNAPSISVYRAFNQSAYCHNDVIFPITVSGTENRFTIYDADQVTVLAGPSIARTYLPNATISSHNLTSTLGVNYYATQTNNNGCESSKTIAIVSVNNEILAPPGYALGTSAINNYCQGIVPSNIGVQLTNNTYGVRWFDNALFLGTPIGAGSTFTTTITGNDVLSNTFFAIQTLEACQGSASLPVTVNVFTTPPTPSMAISTFNTCVGFDFGDLAINATQPNIKWYSNAALT